MKEHLGRIAGTKNFKKVILALGIAFSILSVFIVVKPEPFLKFGYLGVFAFNLFGPGTLLIPTLSQTMILPLLAFATALGMAINDSVSWLVGSRGDVIIPRTARIQKVEIIVRKYGVFGLFFTSLLPLPYDFIGLIAGYLKLPYRLFLIPTFLGRLSRMVLIGMGARLFF